MGRNLSDLVVFIGVRLVQLIPVLLGVVLLMFFLTHVSVSDPCAGWEPHAHPNVIRACIAYFGLNQPLTTQFERYIVSLLSGNWGNDPLSGLPVLPQIAAAFPATLELVLAALVIMVGIGIPLGVVGAANSGRWPDHLVRLFYLSGWATPTYFAALVLVIWVGPGLGLPTGGQFSAPPTFSQPTHMSVLDALLAGNLPATGDAIAHLILPATALAFLNLGIITRMTRSSMLRVLPMDYIKSARMKGMGEDRVLYVHALRNSLISTMSVLGFTVSGLLAGTIVVEEVFRWGGIGEYAYDAIINHNFAGGVGVVIFFGISVVIANLIADIMYGVLDPKVEWR
ncbi:MAG: ABC transporter permease [Thermoplasmata archaeon]